MLNKEAGDIGMSGKCRVMKSSSARGVALADKVRVIQDERFASVDRTRFRGLNQFFQFGHAAPPGLA
jgi:hypothetical protein